MYNPSKAQTSGGITGQQLPGSEPFSRESSSSVSTGKTSLPAAFSRRSPSPGSFQHFSTARTSPESPPRPRLPGAPLAPWWGLKHGHSSWVATKGQSPALPTLPTLPRPCPGLQVLLSPSTVTSLSSGRSCACPIPRKGSSTRGKGVGNWGPRGWQGLRLFHGDREGGAGIATVPGEQRLCWSCSWGHICPSHGKCQLRTSLGRLRRGARPALEQPQEEAVAQIYQQGSLISQKGAMGDVSACGSSRIPSSCVRSWPSPGPEQDRDLPWADGISPTLSRAMVTLPGRILVFS